MDNFDTTGGNYRYSPRLILIVSLLILISLACNLPLMAKTAGPEELPGFVETSIAGTLAARDGGGAQDVVSEGAEGDDNAAPPPEITDTPSLTPTITDTPTPEVAMVYSSANTNCRTGPDTAWPAIFTMYEGDSAEAIARWTVGNYWYINIPDQPGKTCAMWGKYATPSGPYELLPEWTPMPTPTPIGLDFKISYHSFKDCGGPWGVQYRVDNIGAKKIESWKTTVKDHTGGSQPQVTTVDEFYDFNPCWPVDVQVDLTPGEAYYVLAIFNNNPKGHDITTSVTLCSKNGLGGECLTKTFRHKPK